MATYSCAIKRFASIDWAPGTTTRAPYGQSFTVFFHGRWDHRTLCWSRLRRNLGSRFTCFYDFTTRGAKHSVDDPTVRPTLPYGFQTLPQRSGLWQEQSLDQLPRVSFGKDCASVAVLVRKRPKEDYCCYCNHAHANEQLLQHWRKGGRRVWS